jgi:hypothetical protein
MSIYMGWLTMPVKYLPKWQHSSESIEWEVQLQSNNMTVFAILKTENPRDAKKYAEEVQHPEQEWHPLFTTCRQMWAQATQSQYLLALILKFL